MESADMHIASPELVDHVEEPREVDVAKAGLNIIHIKALSPDYQLDIETLVAPHLVRETREFVFSCDLYDLLQKESVLPSVEQQALMLLNDLREHLEKQSKKTQQLCIFVAYDLGALVLKKAISIAYLEKFNWPGIIETLVQFVFWKSFHRRQNVRDFETQLWDFLKSHQNYSYYTSTPYERWKTANGPQILCLEGHDQDECAELAEEVFLAWKSDIPLTEVTRYLIISSMVLQDLATTDLPLTEETTAIHKNFLNRRGWIKKDLHNNNSLAYLRKGCILVLQNIDNCDHASREALWGLIRRFESASEEKLRIVVSYKRGSIVRDELIGIESICQFFTSNEKPLEEWDISNSQYIEFLVDRLGFSSSDRQRISINLQRVITMDKDNLGLIVKLLQSHTGWPDEKSPFALSRFGDLLSDISPQTSPAEVLNLILRSVTNKPALGWLLHWIRHGHRPLTVREACALLYHQENSTQGITGLPSIEQVEKHLSFLHSWLPAVVSFKEDRLFIHDHVQGILRQGPNYIWNESDTAAHETMVNFLISYLTNATVRSHIGDVFGNYLSRYLAAKDNIVPQLVGNDDDFFFYAIQALPYHLTKSHQAIQTLDKALILPEGNLTPWAHMFWSMSNPFSRPLPETVTCAYDILRCHESLDQESREILENIGGGISGIKKYEPMAELLHSLQVGDEKAALDHIHNIISEASQHSIIEYPDATGTGDSLSWMTAILWKATWLDMPRLVSVLLENKTPVDISDNSTSRFPSPLYLASYLGHTGVARVLLQHGADTRALREGKYGICWVAAAKGHAGVVHALVEANPELLDMPAPQTPIYAASFYGCWKTVETLISLKASVDVHDGEFNWTPLLAAASSGHLRIVRMLLGAKADPNEVSGENELVTPLYYAATRGASVDCVQALLWRGANPNHISWTNPLVWAISKARMPSQQKIAILDALANHSSQFDVDSRSCEGRTALMEAVKRGDEDLVKWLLGHGADVAVIDGLGETALFPAVQGAHVSILRELLKQERVPLHTINGKGGGVAPTGWQR
ncbi:hypothetical protein N7472_001983 [Penicillium cf. griseofulvum]|uniref:Uncharacterized protein n=1 Tax=Penicillium cf. griseofulvum TaxID=2972120 RepID=A0A9W9T1L5_9EURO|nr:hypothetical protein N7472_001983 [Penicillium cf. griseofulvum]